MLTIREPKSYPQVDAWSFFKMTAYYMEAEILCGRDYKHVNYTFPW